MGQVQIVLALGDVVGELVADGEAQAVRGAVWADQVQPNQLRLFAAIQGEVGRGQGVARGNHHAAIALVEPFRLRAGSALAWNATLHAPLEDPHRIGEAAGVGMVLQVLVHGVAGGGAAQVGQAGAGDAHMGRIGMGQRGQHPTLAQQRRIVQRLVALLLCSLLFKVAIGRDGCGGQCVGSSGAPKQAHAGSVLVDHADPGFPGIVN